MNPGQAVVRLVCAVSFIFMGCPPPAPPEECPATGMGTLTVTVSGLPNLTGIAPVKISSASESEAIGGSETLTLPGGRYTIVGERVTTDDPRVRSIYTSTAVPSSVCVGPQAATTTVTYAMVPTSNKVWVVSGEADQLAAFESDALAATTLQVATITAGAPAGHHIAFDVDGNLWTIGPTTADAMLNRIAAADLAAPGKKTPDRAINFMSNGCSPGVRAMAFDNSGALWVASPCQDKVVKISAADLARSGNEIVPELEIAVADPRDVAFDKVGNLWVSSLEGLLRFDADTIEDDTTPATPNATIVAQEMNMATLSPGSLAFDKDGNLWADEFGANLFFKIPSSLLSANGMQTVVPAVQITVTVSALLEGFAFDESGGLWTTYSQGKIARLAPSQLNTSSGAGSPTTPDTTVSSTEIASTGALAFFPPPSWSSIFGH